MKGTLSSCMREVPDYRDLCVGRGQMSRGFSLRARGSIREPREEASGTIVRGPTYPTSKQEMCASWYLYLHLWFHLINMNYQIYTFLKKEFEIMQKCVSTCSIIKIFTFLQ